MTVAISSRIVGIDACGDRVISATVDAETGQPRVVALLDHIPENLASFADTFLSISVPDEECLVKTLHLKGSDRGDIELRGKFELSQSMLDPAEAFQFDLMSTSRPDCYIGLAYRRERLQEHERAIGLPDGASHVHLFRSRAASLGLAYRTFCRAKGGELICLADFAPPAVSICILHRHHIGALAHLTFSNADLADSSSTRRLAVNLKTVVNFKLSSLADDGVTIPLSALVISGEPIDGPLKGMLEEYFPMGVSHPELDPALFAAPEVLAEGSAMRSLVALGLTVN